MTRNKKRNAYQEKQCGAMVVRGGVGEVLRQCEDNDFAGLSTKTGDSVSALLAL
jgi:hypothetical protein